MIEGQAGGRRRHRRSRYVRVADSLLDERWPNDVLATAIRLLIFMRRRWARDRLSPEEATRVPLAEVDLLLLTHAETLGGALATIQRLARRASIEVVSERGTIAVFYARHGDRVRIGRTYDVERRIRLLQKEAPGAELIGVEERMDGGARERELARRLAADALGGGWFRASPTVLAEAESNAVSRHGAARCGTQKVSARHGAARESF